MTRCRIGSGSGRITFSCFTLWWMPVICFLITCKRSVYSFTLENWKNKDRVTFWANALEKSKTIYHLLALGTAFGRMFLVELGQIGAQFVLFHSAKEFNVFHFIFTGAPNASWQFILTALLSDNSVHDSSPARTYSPGQMSKGRFVALAANHPRRRPRKH